MHDAKSSLSKLVKRAAAGDDLAIANHGKPIPDESLRNLLRGFSMGRIGLAVGRNDLYSLARLPNRGGLMGHLPRKIHRIEDFEEPFEEF